MLSTKREERWGGDVGTDSSFRVAGLLSSSRLEPSVPVESILALFLICKLLERARERLRPALPSDRSPLPSRRCTTLTPDSHLIWSTAGRTPLPCPFVMDRLMFAGGGAGCGGSWKGGVRCTSPGDCRCMDGVRAVVLCGAGARDALTLVRMLLWCVGVVMAAFFLVISASMSR